METGLDQVVVMFGEGLEQARSKLDAGCGHVESMLGSVWKHNGDRLGEGRDLIGSGLRQIIRGWD